MQPKPAAVPRHIAANFSELKALRKEAASQSHSRPSSAASSSSSTISSSTSTDDSSISSSPTATPISSSTNINNNFNTNNNTNTITPLDQQRLVLGVKNVVACNEIISRMEREIQEMEEEIVRRENGE